MIAEGKLHPVFVTICATIASDSKMPLIFEVSVLKVDIATHVNSILKKELLAWTNTHLLGAIGAHSRIAHLRTE